MPENAGLLKITAEWAIPNLFFSQKTSILGFILLNAGFDKKGKIMNNIAFKKPLWVISHSIKPF